MCCVCVSVCMFPHHYTAKEVGLGMGIGPWYIIGSEGPYCALGLTRERHVLGSVEDSRVSLTLPCM